MATILVVEDNEMNRDMLTRRLKRHGHKVLTAIDGAQGVAMATQEQPEIVLMDMSLPVLDGWEATRRLKADAATAGIPVYAHRSCHGIGPGQALAADVMTTTQANRAPATSGKDFAFSAGTLPPT